MIAGFFSVSFSFGFENKLLLKKEENNGKGSRKLNSNREVRYRAIKKVENKRANVEQVKPTGLIYFSVEKNASYLH